VLLLAHPSCFQLPIIRGILDGGGTLAAVAEPRTCPPDRLRTWRMRMHIALHARWPANIAGKVYQIEDAHSPEFMELLHRRRVDLVVVSRWGILRPEVFEAPPLGCINTHISLLPHLRGNDPIPAALLAGLSHTGVTIHFIDEGIDTGDIILQRTLPIIPGDTEQQVGHTAARLLRPIYRYVIRAFRRGCVPRRPQNHHEAFDFSWGQCFGPRERTTIDWNAPPWLILRVIRLGCCSVMWRERRIEVDNARLARHAGAAGARPGQVLHLADGHLTVATTERPIELTLARHGLQRIFARGCPVPLPWAGQQLGTGRWPGWQRFARWAQRHGRLDDPPQPALLPPQTAPQCADSV
jgi:methionyl-tRNA formyltransferase